jgi:Ser/Thr protein kinase RdoA (MazF antagonist)
MKWLKLILNKEFRNAILDLATVVQDATEDGKLTAKEASAAMKAYWRVVRAIQG